MNPSDNIRLDALGFPIPRTFDDVPSADTAPPRRRGTFTIRMMLLGMAVIAAVMALVRAELLDPIGTAVAKWLASHAQQKYALDDLDGALGDLDRAAAWSDKSPGIFALRGQIRLEKGDMIGSLADFNKVVALLPKVSDAYVLRSRALQRLERHDEAIRDTTQAIALRRGTDPGLLNTRAYTRAIAGRELDAALEDIDLALKIEGESAHFRDTRGYILFLLGRHDEALADMNLAIETESENPPRGFLMPGDARGPRMLARWRREYEHDLAVMYHHRGEIYKQLGNEQQAAEDLRRGDELGYNPDAGVY